MKQLRTIRINRISKKWAKRAEQRADRQSYGQKPLKRSGRNSRLRRIIAYDLETTPIKRGTPKPLYFTAYGDSVSISVHIDNINHFGTLLRERMLIDDFINHRFVAWNGNGFDVFFVGAALLHYPEFELRPYITRSKSLRGLRVIDKTDRRRKWEFLDGIAMTGMIGKRLKEFLAIFAPEYQKLDGPDFESGELFDPDNPAHRRYAERDSEGLYYAMRAAQSIVIDNLGVPLNPTIGNTGIKVFMRHMPDGVNVWKPSLHVITLIRDYVMRGGYCYCVRRYEGPIWKYDINQAYAAAMRDCDLPAGRCMHAHVLPDQQILDGCAIYRVSAQKLNNLIPFYYRGTNKKPLFGITEINETWLTSVEIEQLISECWTVQLLEAYTWSDVFRMTEYVNKLESLRVNAPGGPNGAQGLMMKAIGNNSYGKTVETLDGMELLLSAEKPDGFSEYQAESDELQHVWFRFCDPLAREYHQPQIGAFITAYVRMEVRRAALVDPKSWLYADTDCAIFSNPVSLPLDPRAYGKWKQETNGEIYRIIAKKVYADDEANTRHAKGMNVRRLTAQDFRDWYAGRPPQQTQIHRNNFLKVMTGHDMFIEHVKVGERVKPGNSGTVA